MKQEAKKQEYAMIDYIFNTVCIFNTEIKYFAEIRGFREYLFFQMEYFSENYFNRP